jgi:hypothetical protein
VVEARIDGERLGVSSGLEHVQLRPLVAALVQLEQHAAVRQELPQDRLVVVGQLRELPTRGRQHEQLPRARDVRGHEQPRAVARPRERPRLPQLEEVS